MIGLIVTALQVVLELLRFRREHAATLGVKKLSTDERKRIDSAVVKAVKSKNTADLEQYMRGGDLPSAAEPAPTEGKAP